MSRLPGAGGCGPELSQVAAYGLHAALPSPGLEPGVQDGGVSDPRVPPLARAGLEGIRDSGPVGGLEQDRLDAGGAGEPVDGMAARARLAADRGGREASPEQ